MAKGDGIPTVGMSAALASAMLEAERYINDRDKNPRAVPAYTSTHYPAAADWPYCEIYFTTTGKPAWSTGAAWKYADGSAAP